MQLRRRKRRKSRRVAGAAPGTVRVDPEALPSAVKVFAYGPDAFLEEEIKDLGALQALRAKWPVLWVNVDGLGTADVIGTLGEVFGLHPLALEDVVNVHQRAKVEPYPDTLFTVTRMASFSEGLETEQVSLFLGANFVVTFQERPGDCLEPVRDRIRKNMGRLRKAGPDYLTYAILDAVIDGYFPVLEQVGEHLEGLEEEVVARPDYTIVRRIHEAKRGLLTLRRATWPQREAVNALLREHICQITDDTRIYLRDCYDHVIQIIDMVETYRELASGLLDAYQSSVSNRMNEVMKVLTIIATIFIPLGFMAGLWGMNFDPEKSPYNMPELGLPYGYPCALGLMVTVAIIMLLIFWKMGWFGSPGKTPPPPPRQ